MDICFSLFKILLLSVFNVHYYLSLHIKYKQVTYILETRVKFYCQNFMKTSDDFTSCSRVKAFVHLIKDTAWKFGCCYFDFHVCSICCIIRHNLRLCVLNKSWDIRVPPRSSKNHIPFYPTCATEHRGRDTRKGVYGTRAFEISTPMVGCSQTRDQVVLVHKNKFHYKFYSLRAAGWPSGLVPPSAQGVILKTWDRVPRQAPCIEPASPSAYVSASVCMCFSWINKIFKKNKDHSYCYMKGNPSLQGRKSHRPFSGPSCPLHNRWGWLGPREGAKERWRKRRQ